MTSLLLDKYQKEWDILLSNYSAGMFANDKPTNPLLLDIPPGYFEADCKVMIFGQEPNDWEGLFPHKDGVNHLRKVYRDFYKKNSYGHPFFNGVSNFKQELAKILEPSGKTMNVIWNNVIKIGREGEKGAPSEAVLRWEDRWFDVVSFEVSELKPDIVIFFTGPYYDKYITRIFHDVSFESINERNTRQLARVKSSRLPHDSIRTYHPHYLWYKGFYDYCGEIVGAISC
jgi:hypothetical protein